MVVFLLTLFTALVLLAAGFLLGVFWLRDELARLTVLREEIGQKSMTMQQLAHGHNGNLKSCGELPPTVATIGPADPGSAGQGGIAGG
jgi:hypothetical protein